MLVCAVFLSFVCRCLCTGLLFVVWGGSVLFAVVVFLQEYVFVLFCVAVWMWFVCVCFFLSHDVVSWRLLLFWCFLFGVLVVCFWMCFLMLYSVSVCRCCLFFVCCVFCVLMWCLWCLVCVRFVDAVVCCLCGFVFLCGVGCMRVFCG